MKYKFPLEKVLNHRKNIEDIAQKNFRDAMAILTEEQNKLLSMLDEVRAARESAFQDATRGGTASPGLQQVHEFMQGQDIRIDRQKKRIEEHERRVEELREILRQKAIEYKIIERLKEKKALEFKKEMGKIEQKELDDLNSMRFALNKTKG